MPVANSAFNSPELCFKISGSLESNPSVVVGYPARLSRYRKFGTFYTVEDAWLNVLQLLSPTSSVFEAFSSILIWRWCNFTFFLVYTTDNNPKTFKVLKGSYDLFPWRKDILIQRLINLATRRVGSNQLSTIYQSVSRIACGIEYFKMQRVEVISIQSTRKMFDKIKSNQQREDWALWAVCLETGLNVPIQQIFFPRE